MSTAGKSGLLDRLKAGMVRAAKLIGLIALVYGFAQTLPFDLALIFAGDMLLYAEVAAGAFIAGQTAKVRTALAYSRAVAHAGIRRIGRRWRRASRAVRRALIRENNGDDGDGRPAFA